jgi:hypothetical protein
MHLLNKVVILLWSKSIRVPSLSLSTWQALFLYSICVAFYDSMTCYALKFIVRCYRRETIERKSILTTQVDCML